MVWLNLVRTADGQDGAELRWVAVVVDKEIWTSRGVVVVGWYKNFLKICGGVTNLLRFTWRGTKRGGGAFSQVNLCVFSDTHNLGFGKFWVSEESLRCPNHFWISKSIYAKQGFITTDKRKQKQLHYSILIEDNNLNIISVTSKKASFPFCR